MKKAFTLIELLAVIIILSVIIVIAVPQVLGTVETSKKGAISTDAKLVLNAIEKKKAINPDFDYTTITEENIESILGIKSDNYSDLVITRVNGEPEILIIGKEKYNGYTAYGSYNGINVVNSDDYGSIPPVITLNGESTIEVLIGDNYIEEGATARAVNNIDISSDIVMSGVVDSNTLGTYDIAYNVSDSNGNAATAVVRRVTVVNALKLTYGGTSADYFESITKVPDGYIAVGESASSDVDLTSLNKGGDDGIIVKYDASGNILWKKNFGGTNVDIFYGVTADTDGYIAVGYSFSTDGDLTGLNKGIHDAIIVKYDTNGNVVWNKNYGGTSGDFYNAITSVSDGYIAVGYSSSTNGDLTGLSKGGNDAIVVKYDKNGNIVWNKNYGGTGSDNFKAVKCITNECYIAGSSASTDVDLVGLNKGSTDAILVKYDTNGNVVWNKNYGGTSTDSFNGITINGTQNIIVAGRGNSTDGDLNGLYIGGPGDAILVKYDTNGNVTLKKTFGGTGTDSFTGVTVNSTGDIIAVGRSDSTDGSLSGLNKGGNDTITVKYDVDGNVIWNKNHGGTGTEYFNNVACIINKCYAVGYSGSINGDLTGINKGGTDAIFFRVN